MTIKPSPFGYAYADRMIGRHINLTIAGRDPSAFPNPSEAAGI